jgi:hypothetical protein
MAQEEWRGDGFVTALDLSGCPVDTGPSEIRLAYRSRSGATGWYHPAPRAAAIVTKQISLLSTGETAFRTFWIEAYQ